jgi:hypothetical protein
MSGPRFKNLARTPYDLLTFLGELTAEGHEQSELVQTGLQQKCRDFSTPLHPLVLLAVGPV